MKSPSPIASGNYSASRLAAGANGYGEIATVSEMVKPDIAVITNAGLDHLAGFGGRAGAARANGEVFSAMASNGIAVLNGDDECLPIWCLQAGARPCLRFGFKSGVEVRGNWQPQFDGVALTIESPWGRIKTHLNLIGSHNALNALAAASACLILGIEPGVVAAGLSTARPVTGRLQSQLGASGVRIIIDDTYNANPSSLAAALDTLAIMPGKKILVLGDMAELGDDTDTWHGWAGQAARMAGIAELFAVGKLTRLAAESFGGTPTIYPMVKHWSKPCFRSFGLALSFWSRVRVAWRWKVSSRNFYIIIASLRPWAESVQVWASLSAIHFNL